MPSENRRALAKFRMEKAFESLEDARLLFANNRFATCANRSYYAMFHAARAALAFDGLDFKKHSAVIGKFRELYVKTGIFDSSLSKMIGDAFDIRGDSDGTVKYFAQISLQSVKKRN